MSRTHSLTAWPDHFASLLYEKNKRTFEIRKNDVGYKVGDWLWIREWDPNVEDYTGNSITVCVCYMTDFKQLPGYVVLGIAN